MNERYIKKRYLDPKAPGSFGSVSTFLKHNPQFKDRRLVEKVLRDLKTVTLHGVLPRNFKRRRVIVSFPREIVAADLIDFSKHFRYNKGLRWILVIVDVFSRYCWAYGLKDKSAQSVFEAFEKHLSIRGNQFKSVWADEGLEFYNSLVKNLFKKHNIIFILQNLNLNPL